MRIAVIADTHGRLPSHLVDQIATADEIWHLGDYCDLATLEAVRAIGRPFFGILGNNDFGMDLPETLKLERDGRSFFLIHIPPSPTQIGGADFLLHGHTHVPRDEVIRSTRVLNPGTVGKPNHGAPISFAWMTLSDGGVSFDVSLL